MDLNRLLTGLPGILAVHGAGSPNIQHITSDSRQVSPGALFVAYRGTGVDGHQYVPDALARGAVAVAGEQDWRDLPVPYVQVDDGRAALAWLMAAWYGHPSRSMTVVGVTGTDGKTTTANLIYSILRAAGRRAGLVSTVNAIIGDQYYDTGLHTTTPDAGDVQRYLAQMRAAGTEVVVLETTSHGLAQQRVAGCAFDVAVVTNITHEHLDFHGTYEAYREAKAMLFRYLATAPHKPGISKTAVLNRDDGSYDFLAGIPAERRISYGLQAGSATSEGAGMTLTAGPITYQASGTAFDVSVNAGGVDIVALSSPLLGEFNVSNCLAAMGAAMALGLPPQAIQTGVRQLAGVAGRMERIDDGQEFLALVDFAHTPNALAKALKTAHEFVAPGGRVIVVFGCAGLRDRAKRRMMGEVAARLADYTLVTAEDPRTEDLAAIIEETCAALAAGGRQEGRDYARVPDRQRAILQAVNLARPGDVVLACGKGHEQSMCFGSTEYPWRDQDALRWALARQRGQGTADPPFILPTW